MVALGVLSALVLLPLVPAECISLLGGKISACFSDKLSAVRASINGIRGLTRDLWSVQYTGLTYKDALNQPQI